MRKLWLVSVRGSKQIHSLVKIQRSLLSNPFVHKRMLTTRLYRVSQVDVGEWCLWQITTIARHIVCVQAYCLAVFALYCWESSSTKHFTLRHNSAVVATRLIVWGPLCETQVAALCVYLQTWNNQSVSSSFLACYTMPSDQYWPLDGRKSGLLDWT